MPEIVHISIVILSAVRRPNDDSVTSIAPMFEPGNTVIIPEFSGEV